MIRTIFLALLGIGLVFALACVFPLLLSGWYGDLLFQACLLFGVFGLVAGFAFGFLARQGGTQVVTIRGLGGRIEPGQGPQAGQKGQAGAPNDSRFITSPTDGKPGKWGATSRR